MFAESRRLLVGVLLSEHHETCRELGAQCLQQVSLLSSVAHQWVLLLLSDSMAEAESKPRFCSEYFQQFARAVQALPQQSQAVRAFPHSAAGTVPALVAFHKCPESQPIFQLQGPNVIIVVQNRCPQKLVCSTMAACLCYSGCLSVYQQISFLLHRCSRWSCKQPISC